MQHRRDGGQGRGLTGGSVAGRAASSVGPCFRRCDGFSREIVIEGKYSSFPRKRESTSGAGHPAAPLSGESPQPDTRETSAASKKTPPPRRPRSGGVFRR
ncbi:hypothetical protein C882_1913 [Caenispirillum salinarum AK4]|uniref:Uncharacterized protein n=1 Tax=Caenispirillum salinarum AK4 TaxID=1238182 RepID=K9GQG3_9PROT|nr:hypothetical protein C882_1913 [Caenispirillum salinarum AK4]